MIKKQKIKSLSREKLPNRVIIRESRYTEQIITATPLFQIARTFPSEQKTVQTSIFMSNMDHSDLSKLVQMSRQEKRILMTHEILHQMVK